MVGFLLAAALCAATPSADDQVLINAAMQTRVMSVTTGQWDPLLQQLAHDQAAYCARVGVQGHQLFASQFARYSGQCPGLKSVVAESWPSQTREESGPECIKCWRLSSGHWQAVNGQCGRWGYAMVRGSNGIWYGAGYFCN